VGSQHVFKTILPALKFAKNGDTVLVEKGFYKEGNIIINKEIYFLGRDFPTIDGDRKFEVLSIKSNNVTVKGFKIQHSGYATMDDPGGIKVYDSHHVTIIDNLVYDNFFGIYIQYSKNCIIKNNKIIAFGKEEQEIGNGIHCWKSDSLQIIGNYVSGNRDGIYFEFVTNSVIWRNISANNMKNLINRSIIPTKIRKTLARSKLKESFNFTFSNDHLRFRFCFFSTLIYMKYFRYQFS
jgi:nitrous oxidase accessory protein